MRRIVASMCLVIALPGCADPSIVPETDLVLTDGDYLLYEIHDGSGEPSYSGVVYHATEGGLAEQVISPPEPDGALQMGARTLWREPSGAIIGVAIDWDTSIAGASGWFASYPLDPCPTYPDLTKPESRQVLTCTTSTATLDPDGEPLSIGTATSQREVSPLSWVEVPLLGRTVGAWKYNETGLSGRGDAILQTRATQWLAPAACGVIRSESAGITASLVGYRCGGEQRGLTPADLSGVRSVPLVEISLEDHRSVPLRLGPCQIREIGAGAGDVRQYAQSDACHLAADVSNAQITTTRVTGTWDADPLLLSGTVSVVLDGTVLAEVTGSSPLVLDVDGPVTSDHEIHLRFDGATIAPAASIRAEYLGLAGRN